MPPNSTKNLFARLSLTSATRPRRGGSGPSFAPPPIRSSGPPTQIVRGPATYRGGYHLSF